MELNISAKHLHETLNVQAEFKGWFRRMKANLVLEDGVECLKVDKDWMLTSKAAELVKASVSLEHRRGLVDRDDLNTKLLRKACEPIETSQLAKVYMDNLEIKTTSLAIAEHTGKQHKHVIRDIENTIRDLENLLSPKVDPKENTLDHHEYNLRGFVKSSYIDSIGRTLPMYELNFNALLLMLNRYSVESRSDTVYLLSELLRSLQQQAIAAMAFLHYPPEKLTHRYVYIMEGASSGKYKIGISTDPYSRAKELSTSSEQVNLIYVSPLTTEFFDIEAELHSKFAEYQTHREWFDESLPVHKVVECIEDLPYSLKPEV